MLSLIIPVYKNEPNLPSLLDAVEQLDRELSLSLEVVFVVDGSPDRCYDVLCTELPTRDIKSQVVLLARNFGSFAAIRAGLQSANGHFFAVMAADLQEPPELVLDMARILSEGSADVVIGVRDSRKDPVVDRMASRIFWGLYRRYVIPEMPSGGVDIFACNSIFRESLLRLEERHSSLIAQVFWLGYRRQEVRYARRKRVHGKSSWTFGKKVSYLMDSVFSFTDLPLRMMLAVGVVGAGLSILFGLIVAMARVVGLISEPGYAATIIVVTFLGSLNLLGLGVVGSYAWRTYENTKARPLAIVLRKHFFEGDK